MGCWPTHAPCRHSVKPTGAAACAWARPAMTIRGMGAESFTVVADLLADLVSAPADAPLDDAAARRIAELAMAYPIPDGMIAT